MVKGMGGAMDLAATPNTRTVITMEHCNKVTLYAKLHSLCSVAHPANRKENPKF
jgi:acyl CoA:acetate/3-ketoacid CoA transferase beta subunit